MRIKELLESKHRDDFAEFVDQEKGLLYNLAEDLVYFMNNDDDVYRRHLYPTIIKCINRIEQNHKINPLIFKSPALESYKEYCSKYPIKELPHDLDDETITEVCNKYYEELRKNYDEGKYH